MKIYTKTGDDGTTGLFGGGRVKKSDVQVEAYGTIDELNAQLGLLIEEIRHRNMQGPLKFKESLNWILPVLFLDAQNLLFCIGANLASSKGKVYDSIPSEEHISQLEKQMDLWNEKLPELKNFTLPRGSVTIAQAHCCRTICRRAERALVALNEEKKSFDMELKWLNRFSDLLFVMSRALSYHEGVEEVLWKVDN